MERSSTDKRIDDLTGRVGRFEANVNQQFDKVDRRFERLEDEVDARFDRVDARAETMVTKEQFQEAAATQGERMGKIDARLDRWGKVVSGGVVAIAGSVVAKVLGF
jgi:hypothetical protein